MKNGWQCRWLPLSLPIASSWALLWVQPPGEIAWDRSDREEGFSVKRERTDRFETGGSRRNELEKGEEGEENSEQGGCGRGVCVCRQ